MSPPTIIQSYLDLHSDSQTMVNRNSKWLSFWLDSEWSGFSDLEWYSNTKPLNIQISFNLTQVDHKDTLSIIIKD